MEDSVIINNDLFSTVLNIFTKVGLIIPDAAIDNIFRLGKVPGNRPLLIKFNGKRWVRDVFSKVDEIKQLNYIITNDRSKEGSEMRRQLHSKIFKLCDDGYKVSLIGNKIYLNDSIINKEKLESLLVSGGPPALTTIPGASHSLDPTVATRNRKGGLPRKELSLSSGKSPLSKTLVNYFSPRVSTGTGDGNGDGNVKKQRIIKDEDSSSEL